MRLPMFNYNPLIHKIKKMPEAEPLPLYIELLDPSLYPPSKKDEESEEKSNIIIIQL